MAPSDYSAYDDDRREEPRRYKSTRTRPRGRDDPDYIEETTYVEKGKGPPPRDLVYRPREREDSIEEVPRDFPPPSRGVRSYRDDDDYDDQPPRRRRARSQAGRSGYDDYEDDYGPAAAGAAGGYALSRRRSGRDRDRADRRRERDGYYSDEYERYDRYSDSGSRSPRRGKDKRKSGIESTLEGLGLGGVVGALTGKSRSKSRSRAGSRESSRSRSRGPKEGRSERQWAQAAQAAIVAGAVEAFRARNEPGGWSGAKGKRVATAAIGAGGIDKLVTGKGDPENKSKRHLVEAVLGGLAANRLANGPVDKDADGRGRSRSRSRSRSVFDRFRSKSRGRSRSSEDSREGGRARSKSRLGGVEKLAAGGALAAAGKAIYDRVRSKSRGAKDRRRSPSNSSEDSYVPSRSRRRDVGTSRGLDGEGYGPDDRAVSDRGRAAGAGGGDAAIGSRPGEEHKDTGGGKNESDDTSSSSALEQKRKKMRGKELLTAGLATVATIHAAHGVYQSMEGSEKRHKLVAEGEMSPEEARKKRSKAWLQDAAAVGIAALGVSRVPTRSGRR